MRKGYHLVPMMEIDRKRAMDIAEQLLERFPPKEFVLVTTRETDPVTDNDTFAWEEELIVDGYPAYFGMGFALTRELKQQPDLEDKIAQMRSVLRMRAWQEHELVRLGYYKWKPNVPAQSHEWFLSVDPCEVA